MVTDFGIDFFPIHCGKLRRYFSFQNFLDFFKFFIGIFQSFIIIGEIKPDVVFSKGGFVGLPVVIGAFFRRKKCFIHESDLTPGLANRISLKFCDKVFVSFIETKKFIKKFKGEIIFSGSPVREEIFHANKENAEKILNFKNKKPIIFVIGGSTGAKQLNDLISKSAKVLFKEFNIIHQFGKNKKIDINNESYRGFDFIKEEYFDFLALSDLVISRAGANALFELEVAKKNALIIPMESGRGDQVLNAQIFGDKIGWTILKGNFEVKDFIESINISIAKQNLNFSKFKNATKLIADKLMES